MLASLRLAKDLLKDPAVFQALPILPKALVARPAITPAFAAASGAAAPNVAPVAAIKPVSAIPRAISSTANSAMTPKVYPRFNPAFAVQPTTPPFVDVPIAIAFC